jgi:uncharacterized protein with HEPN domain
MARDPRIALDDMIVAIDRIAEELRTLTFEPFAKNWRWIGVRDIGNVIRHQYASLSPSLIWNVARDELPRLRAAAAAIRSDLET